MATFERYFLTDKSTHKEEKGYYYTISDNEESVRQDSRCMLSDGQHRHIINGHVPVRTNKGETPIRANGKLMVIDGGFAKAYHNTTESRLHARLSTAAGSSLCSTSPSHRPRRPSRTELTS